MKDLAKKTRLQKYLQGVEALRRKNQEEVHEDQPEIFSKSCSLSHSFLPSSLRPHGDQVKSKTSIGDTRIIKSTKNSIKTSPRRKLQVWR